MYFHVRAAMLAAFALLAPFPATAQPASPESPTSATQGEEMSAGELTLSVNEPVQRRFDAQMEQNRAAQEAYDQALADYRQSQADYADAQRAYEAERARIAELKAANDEEQRAYAAKAAAYEETIANWPKTGEAQPKKSGPSAEKAQSSDARSPSQRCNADRTPMTGSLFPARSKRC